MYYLVDGEVMKYALHHRVKKPQAVQTKTAGIGLISKEARKNN